MGGGIFFFEEDVWAVVMLEFVEEEFADGVGEFVGEVFEVGVCDILA